MPDEPEYKVRRRAWRKYEIGSYFREEDGLYVVEDRQSEPAQMTYTYKLRKLTPDEVACLEVSTA